jgi:hypothetical protein
MFFKKRDDQNTNGTAPGPLVVEPSGDFDGNDGKWSTFYINIGDADGSGSGHNFKVLVSTSSAETLVPSQSEWCSSDCAKERGIQIFNGEQPLGFDTGSSSSWKKSGLNNIPLPEWWSGGERNGTWGSDNVGLGESSKESIILTEQVVVTYTFRDFYLGSFGLAAGSVQAGSSVNYPFLYNLAKAGTIPSVSYGHTAGASYRE